MKRHKKESFELNREDMSDWLKQRFAEKEELLKSFYENRVFLGKKVVCEDTRVGHLFIAGCTLNLGVLFFTYYIVSWYPLVMLGVFGFCTLHALYFVKRFGK